MLKNLSLVLVLLVAISLAACGGGNPGGPDPTPTPTATPAATHVVMDITISQDSKVITPAAGDIYVLKAGPGGRIEIKFTTPAGVLISDGSVTFWDGAKDILRNGVSGISDGWMTTPAGSSKIIIEL